MELELRNVSFVLLPRFNMMSLTTMIEPMRIANYLAPQQLYHWDLRSPDETVVTASNGLQVNCVGLDQETSPSPDTIILCGSWGADRYDNKMLFSWLRRQARDNRQMIAVEMGIYGFARAGLLSGEPVTTHWSMMAGFVEDFPHINVCEQLYTLDRNFMTCGGGTAGLDLMLHLVAQQNGEQLASEVANQMLHHPRRPPEGMQRFCTGGKMDDVHPEVRAAMALLEARIEEPSPISEVCREIGVSQRKLERLFRRDTGCTIVQFSKLLRLQYARVLLSSTRMSIREVSVACGFNSMSYFSLSFLKTFNKKPSEYRHSWPDNEATPSWPGTVFAFIQQSVNLKLGH